ncbi:hypothetical protein PROFUN_12347 [Planoprotostelium fungivorum]|uniref:Uncharacterized protein n=1 Tax=Planoprotostelium fungivorum TaxID=1890364 RepID=A0A2P6N9F9_9EUKA|nr:hypothetical protein PROFUN_12347 [Planoprotostelium fungivorum]
MMSCSILPLSAYAAHEVKPQLRADLIPVSTNISETTISPFVLKKNMKSNLVVALLLITCTPAATATSLDYCYNTATIGSVKVVVTNNVANQTNYEKTGCTGAITSTGVASLVGQCNNGKFAQIGTSFNPLPSTNDTAEHTYLKGTCDGAIVSTLIQYGAGCNSLAACTTNNNTGTLSSTKIVCGNNAVFPDNSGTSSGEGAALLVGYLVLATALFVSTV